MTKYGSLVPDEERAAQMERILTDLRLVWQHYPDKSFAEVYLSIVVGGTLADVLGATGGDATGPFTIPDERFASLLETFMLTKLGT